MGNRRTHGWISLLGKTRSAGERCLVLTRETLSPSYTRQSSNASTGCIMHFLEVKSIPS